MAETVTLEPAVGIRVSWELAVEEGSVPAWQLDGSLEPDHSALRILSATTTAGVTLLLASARPAGADAHDAETVSALLLERSAEPREVEEALLSTEYGGDGLARRITLELAMPEDEYPLRGAGDAVGTSRADRDGLRVETAELDFRLDGNHGQATYSILHA